MAWNRRRWRGAVLLLLPALAACETVGNIDAAMRRVDVLDRFFGEVPAPEPAPRPVAAPRRPQVAAQVQAPREPEPEAVAPALPIVPPELPKSPPPPSAPEEQVATAGRPAPPVDPAARRAALLRQNPWIAGFWGQLSTSQKGWATRRMQRGGATLDADSVAAAWDRMGLAERVTLLFGDGA